MSTKIACGIFIAEDNPADVRLLGEALQRLTPCPEILVASDGDGALSHLLNESKPAPALLFLDFNLPKTDSRTVLKTLRSEARLKDTAIVIISGSEAEEAIHEAYALGADCYLSKPADLDEFLAMIQQAAQYWLGFPAAR